MRKEIGRRRFAKSTGILALTGAALAGEATASESSQSSSTSENEITGDIKNHLKKGEIDKAKRLLDKYDIEYYSKKKDLNPQDGSQGEIGTQAAYGKDESYVSLFVLRKDGNVYDTMGTAFLGGSQGTGILQYASKTPDPCGLHWDSDDWEALDPDTDNVNTSIVFGGSGDGPDIDVEEYDSDNGIAAEVNFDNEAQLSWDTFVNVDTEIVKVNDDSHIVPVSFEYHHNTTNSSTLSSLSLSIGPAGLSIDTSHTNEQWDLDVTAGPGESNSDSN